MEVTTALRQEAKSQFFPLMQQRGFVLDERDAPNFLRFRRITPTEAHIVEIQWEKYGRPRFAINFGRCSKDGVVIRGERFPVEKISANWLLGSGRLQPGRKKTVGGWFRQDKPLVTRLFSSEKQVPASKVIAQLISLYPEVEEYWERGTVGQHLTIYSFGV
jgi:hypothetical protein